MAFDFDPSTANTPFDPPSLQTNEITVGDTSISNTAYIMPTVQGKKHQVMYVTDTSVDPAVVDFQNPGLVPAPAVITADPTTVEINTEYKADTSGGAFVFTLPSNPIDGVSISVVDSVGNFDVAAVTVTAGTGDKINDGSVAGTDVLSTKYGTTVYKYDLATLTWIKSLFATNGTFTRSTAGDLVLTVSNTDTTSTSDAQVLVSTVATGGDAYQTFTTTTGTFSLGVDQDDNVFTMSASAALGTTDVVKATSALWSNYTNGELRNITAAGAKQTFYQSKGTLAVPTATLLTEVLGTVAFDGYDNAGPENSANIFVTAQETFLVGAHGTTMTFQTKDSGTTALVSKLVIGNSINFNTTSGNFTVDRSATATGALVATFLNSATGGTASANTANILVQATSAADSYVRCKSASADGVFGVDETLAYAILQYGVAPTVASTVVDLEGIGVNASTAHINLNTTIRGTYDQVGALATLSKYAADAAPFVVNMVKNRKATEVTTTDVVLTSGDVISSIRSSGYDANTIEVVGAKIDAEATETWGATASGTALKFYSTKAATNAAVEKLRITENVSCEGTTGAFMPTRLTTTQRDALTAIAGMICYNTTSRRLEHYDGTSWRYSWAWTAVSANLSGGAYAASSYENIHITATGSNVITLPSVGVDDDGVQIKIIDDTGVLVGAGVTLDSSDTDSIDGIAQGVGISLDTNNGVWLLEYVHVATCWRFVSRPDDEVREYLHQQNALEKTLFSASNAIAWDLNVAQVAEYTAIETTTFTITNMKAGGTYSLRIINGDSFLMTWPTIVKWPAGVEPKWTKTGTDVACFTSNGTNLYGVASLDFQ